MQNPTGTEQTRFAGAGDVLAVKLVRRRAAVIIADPHDPYATEPDVDVELRLAGAAGIWRQTA